jgi:hypothetical protein
MSLNTVDTATTIDQWKTNYNATCVVVGDYVSLYTAPNPQNSDTSLTVAGAKPLDVVLAVDNLNDRMLDVNGGVVKGNLTVKGNTQIGDASSDTLTVFPNAVTWSNNPTHSGNHTYSANVTVTGTADFNGVVTINGDNVSTTIAPTGTGTITVGPNTAGTINNMSIGATTALTGRFTTVTLTDATDAAAGTGSFVTVGGISAAKDVYVGGNDITGPATGAVTIFNQTTGTVSLSTSSTAVTIGATNGTVTVGDIAVNGGDLTTTAATFNALSTSANTTSISIGTALSNVGAKTISIGTGGTGGAVTVALAGTISATGATTTFNNATNAITLVGNTGSTTANVFNTISTTVNAFGAATTLGIGAATGTTTIGNDLVVNGATSLKGNNTIGDASGDTLTVHSNAVTWQNAPTHSNNHTFSGNLTVTGVLTGNGNVTLGDAAADTITVNGTVSSYLLANSAQLKTGTTATNTFSIAAYDTDTGPAYVNMLTATAGTTPSLTFSGSMIATSATWTNLGTVTTVAINGGTINSTTIGATTASSGKFTTLDASGATHLVGNFTIDGANTPVAITPTGTSTVSITSAVTGNINNMNIGGTTKAQGAFTSLTANGATTLTASTSSTTTGTGTLVVTGGVGISENLNVGGTATVTGTTTLNGALTVTGANVTTNIAPTGTGTVTLSPATAGTINNMSIGASTRASGAFTSLTANTAVTLTQGTDSSAYNNGTLVVTGGVGISGKVFTNSDVAIAGDITVSGNDLKCAAGAATMFNEATGAVTIATGASSVQLGGASTTLTIPNSINISNDNVTATGTKKSMSTAMSDTYTYSITVASAALTSLFEISPTTYRSAEVTIQSTRGTEYYMTKFSMLQDGPNSNSLEVEYGSLGANPPGNFNTDRVDANIWKMTVTQPVPTSTVYKVTVVANKV